MKNPALRWLLVLTLVAACSSDNTGPKTQATPTKLAFSAQPTNAVKDTAFPNPIKVRLLDQNGALTTATDNVTLALGVNPGHADLTGALTVAAVGGVASFPGLKLDSLGSGYRLVATSGTLPGDTSAAFNVTLSLKDADGDGYSPNAGDCNDADSTVHPLAVDFPDPAHVDKNCDGLDGEKANAVFVSVLGADSAGCGGQAAPCKSIQFGTNRAVATGKRDVYVTAGGYAGFTVADGVNVFGGFDDSWNRSAANVVSLTGHQQVVAGLPDSQVVTVVANGLTKGTILADLTMVGAGATGADTSGAGRNSYVVLARNVTGPGLQVLRSHLLLGHGSDGVAGVAGADADSLTADSAMAGGVGGNAKDTTVTCDNTSHGAGGLAGAPEGASGGSSRVAGKGGDGGTMDTACDFDPFNYNVDYTATAGLTGDTAGQVVTGFGHGGSGGSGAAQCGTAGDGEPGRITNGPGGQGGSGAGVLVSGAWRGARGASGQVGEDGGGGGGGGGSGGCDNGVDSWGAGGGGGGAGGVGAKEGGGGGAAGGGVFGIYVLDAVVIASGDSIVGGIGGAGGGGGQGGQGQSGGVGGQPGVKGSNGGAAGKGGDGGHGGHAGGGGGGAGGVVYGIYVATVGSALTAGANIFVAGTGGSGGNGGLSAPNAPVAERDGNAGKNGVAGVVGSVGSCSAPGGC